MLPTGFRWSGSKRPAECHDSTVNPPQKPSWSDAVDEADWIRERLAPFGDGVVSSVVPGGVAAYARVMHPAEEPYGDGGRLVRWREVAAWNKVPLQPMPLADGFGLGHEPARLSHT
jgi:hypothetical protein